MNVTDVERIQRQPEGQFLERKSCYEYVQGKWRLRKAKDVARDIAETISAFANADGGTLLLGVNDDGNVSGVAFPEDKLSIIRNATKSLIKPILNVQMNEIVFQNKKLFLFTVHWRSEVYQLSDGRYLLRVGDSNMPFPADQIEMLKSGKRKAVFESRIGPTAIWELLSTELLIEFGKKVGINKTSEEILSEY